MTSAEEKPAQPSNDTAPATPHQSLQVALFVTCLVDMFRPSVGFATVKLLEDAGCRVSVPTGQTCCGQPAYNSGDRKNTVAIAKQTIKALEGYDYVVAPSGSCAAMISKHYPDLMRTDTPWAKRARAVAMKTFEITQFLTDVLKLTSVNAKFEEDVVYHDSCSGLRELNIKTQPRALLSSVDGLHFKDLMDEEGCCGFGGTFCVKYSDVSNKIVDRKIEAVKASGADTLLAGDLGCLMNMAGKLSRDGSTIRVRHVAEVLAGMTDGPAIGEPQVDDTEPDSKQD